MKRAIESEVIENEVSNPGLKKDVLGDVLFAGSHGFSAFLRACKDPEYEETDISDFADRVVRHMRFAGQTSAEMPLVLGELRGTDFETGKVVIEVEFYWADNESAFYTQGYVKPSDDFIPLLRNDDSAPLLRIRWCGMDHQYFRDWVTGGYGDIDIVATCRPVEINLEEDADDSV